MAVVTDNQLAAIEPLSVWAPPTESDLYEEDYFASERERDMKWSFRRLEELYYVTGNADIRQSIENFCKSILNS